MKIAKEGFEINYKSMLLPTWKYGVARIQKCLQSFWVLSQFTEVEAVFKKIHEGLDLFNYYFSRHEASTNGSQREKLEIKKDIKKLQKFRDQIKSWQGNDSLEATIASSKLQEHRRLVAEAMECYKDVEKHSKRKSFSNQSIMLAALDRNDHDLSNDVKEATGFFPMFQCAKRGTRRRV